MLLYVAGSFGQEEIKPSGYNRIYYPSGSIQSEGNLVDGKPEGYWKNYYPTGVVKSEGKRTNFQLDSIWIFYTITGDTSSKISYLNGMKNGYSFEYVTQSDVPINIGNVLTKELYVNNSKEGLSYYYYSNGNIKEIANYENNSKEGVSTEFAEDGRVITIKKYRRGTLIDREKINQYDKDGNKDNVWRTFYPNMKIKTEAYYKNGILDGYYKEYDVNGSLINTVLYQDGRLVQEVAEDEIESKEKFEYFEDGSIKSSGFYNNENKPIGLHKSYSRHDSVIIAFIYNDNSEIVSSGNMDKNSNRTGVWKTFYPGGQIKSTGLYKNNLKEGKWKYLFGDGKIEQEGEFLKGKYTGLWTYYYPDGKIWKEEEYYNGLEEGSYAEYDEEGNILVSGEYFDGEREGLWTTQINDNKAVGKYVTGLMDSKWKYYYDDGTLLFEGNFVQGSPDGKHKYYYPNGNIKEEQYYSSGLRQKNWKKYSPDGELIITITYRNDKEYRINGVKIEFPIDLPEIIE